MFLADPPLEVTSAEEALCEAAAPLLQATLQGVPSAHLASSAEVYALLLSRGVQSHSDVLGSIVQEAVRKLSNFDATEL